MTEPSLRRARRVLVLAGLLLVAVPATASAQATRTWISGVGDDVNPCSRTAPCKTWKGAYDKTVEGGEVNAIDSMAAGTLAISKSITLDGNGFFVSTLGCGTNGFVINSATAKVTLRDFRINGCRNTTSPGVYGVRAMAVKSLRLESMKIFGFGSAGVALEPSNAKARVQIHRSSIHDNAGYGVLAKPAAGGTLKATVSRSRIDDNGNGIHANSASGASTVRVFDSSVTDSGVDGDTGYGLSANGTSAVVRAGDSRITGNVYGLFWVNLGQLISYGGNIVDDNDTDGDFTGSVARK